MIRTVSQFVQRCLKMLTIKLRSGFKVSRKLLHALDRAKEIRLTDGPCRIFPDSLVGRKFTGRSQRPFVLHQGKTDTAVKNDEYSHLPQCKTGDPRYSGKIMRISVRLRFFRLFLCTFAIAAAPASAQPKPWPVKIVIVTTFEVGGDTGDAPGEFQFWVEREHLDSKLPFPGGVRDLRANADYSIIGIVTGGTIGPAASSIMALGLDPRFDFAHAYWLVSGIAGVDPADASIASAAWANFVVSDIAREIDPREAPADWPYGIFALGAMRPNQPPDPAKSILNERMAYSLNAKLAGWAYQLTKDIKLTDTPEMAALRAEWQGYPNAQRPPFVLQGDSFASDYYWHGKILTEYANDWVKLFTKDQGNFVMTNMEDAGIAEALKRLDAMHRADFSRLMVLRTGSNYSMQRPGHTAAESITAPYVGYVQALESAYRVGSTVVHELIRDWPKWEKDTPATEVTR
jgi:purine nucleoside permease